MSVHIFPRQNNFDALRLLFAITVFVSHLTVLTDIPALNRFAEIQFFAARAVESFFIISGFLIFGSYDRSRSVLEYCEKRIRRIYPAYVFNVIFFATFLFFFSSVTLSDYLFGEGGMLRFLFDRLIFLNDRTFTLPGVFADHQYTSVNGALWTLKMEVLFYLATPFIIFLCRKLGTLPILGCLYLFSCVFTAMHAAQGISFLMNQFAHSLGFFIAGSILYCFLGFFSAYRHALFVIVLVSLLFAAHTTLMIYLFPLALAILVLYAAFCIPFIGNAAKYGDLSYGIYIYHFPIIQILIDLVPSNETVLFASLAFILVPLSALFSWHCIEKRFLYASSHYVRETVKIHAA